jgi:hypothetical protein
MKELFEALQERLMDIEDLRMIDFDLGQLEAEPLPPLDYPAVLISFSDSQFLDLGGLTQNALVTITLRVAFRVFERTHSIAKDEWRAEGLKHLEVLDKIKWALHGFAGDCFAPLSHRGFATEPRADLRVYSLNFETLLSVAPPERKYIPWSQAEGAEGVGPEFCVDDDSGGD